MNTIARWLRLFTPSPGSFGWLIAAAGVLLVSALCGLVLATQAGSSTTEYVSVLSVGPGWLGSPIASLLVGIAAIREKRGLPRAMLWGVTALLVLIGGLLLAASFALNPNGDLQLGVVLYTAVCLPPGFLLLGATAYFGYRAWLQIQAERAARTLQMFEARGDAHLTEVATELDLPLAQAEAVVRRLIHSGRLVGRVDAVGGRVYTGATLDARQRQMLGAVIARGQITFDTLVDELQVPREWLRDWVYQAVKRGEFTGYLDWKEGVLYSADAEKLRADSRCPRCGGELALAGKGIVQCSSCGSEIFL